MGSTAFQTPRTPCGPATPHPCWQWAANPQLSCCVECLQAQSFPCLMASPGWQWTSAPTAYASLPLPKGRRRHPATCMEACTTHQQDGAITPTKNGLPIMLVKKQVLQRPCWSLCGPSQPKHSLSKGCRNPSGLHFMGWVWTVNVAVEDL